MTFLAPIWLAAAAAAAFAVVLLHLLARRRPKKQLLPTARFIPPHSAQATTRTMRPTDIWLLILRVLLLMAVGAGLARPVLDAPERPRIAVILADVSRSTPSTDVLRSRLNARYRNGDIIIPFDSAPHAHLSVASALPDLSRAPGSISAAMIAALKAARGLRARHDSIELTIISALSADEMDRATARIRALWPGRITLDRLESAQGTHSLPRVDVRAGAGDAVTAAARLHVPRGGSREVRVVRSGATHLDRQWADSGRVLVDWPAIMRSGGATDTSSALIAGDAIVVAPFVRSLDPAAGSAIVRWADGRPAATEQATGAGCIRSVAIAVPDAGDLALRADFGRLLKELTAQCQAFRVGLPLSAADASALAGAGPLATGKAFPVSAKHRDSIAPWLFGVALLLALAEPFVRRRSAPQ